MNVCRNILGVLILLCGMLLPACGEYGDDASPNSLKEVGLGVTARLLTEEGRPAEKGASAHLSTVLARNGEGWIARVRVIDLPPTDRLWISLDYNARVLSPVRARSALKQKTLFLGVTDLPGEVPLVMATVDGRPFPGEALIAEVEFAETPYIGARRLSEASRIDLTEEAVTYEGGGVRLSFKSAITGDYNGDGVAGGTDLFAIASNFGRDVSQNPDALECIDGNHDGRIDGADVFPLAGNFMISCSQVEIWRSAEGAGGPYELIATLDEADAAPSACGRAGESYTILDAPLDPGIWHYYARVIDKSFVAGSAGDPVQASVGPGEPPLPPINITAEASWLSSELEWEDPGNLNLSGFNVYRRTEEIPYDFGKPVNHELIAGFAWADETDAVQPDSKFYYIVRALDMFDVESENGMESEVGPVYPWVQHLVPDRDNDRLVIVGTNSHPDNAIKQSIVWDSDTVQLYRIEDSEKVPLEPAGLSDVRDARWYPNVIPSYPRDLSLLLVPDAGNQRLLGIDLESGLCVYELDFSASGIVPYSAAFVSGGVIPDIVFIGTDPKGEYDRMLFYLDAEVGQPPEIIESWLVTWDDAIRSVRFVDSLTHPDAYDDDGEPGDDPPYTGPALLFVEEGSTSDRVHVWGLPDGDFSSINILSRFNSNVGGDGVESRFVAASTDGTRLVLADKDRQRDAVQFRGFKNDVDYSLGDPWDERTLSSGDYDGLGAEWPSGITLDEGDYGRWTLSLSGGAAFTVDFSEVPPLVDWVLDLNGISAPGPVEKMQKPIG